MAVGKVGAKASQRRQAGGTSPGEPAATHGPEEDSCTAGSQPPAAAAPPVDQRLKMAEAIGIGMKGAAAAKKEKKEKFANHEKVKILAACGLHEGKWD